jgi:CDP-glucose 4,6-dehydratase
MNKAFWRGKRVLITGYEGFLGSNLTKKLLSCGARIVGLDIKVRRKTTILDAADYKRFKVVKGDVADYQLLKRIISGNKIQIVFHLAAEAIVGRSLKDPLETFSSNIKGTWSLLEACRKVGGVQAIVVASSDKAYGSHKVLPYDETFALAGNHPYDASKSCADLLAHTYSHTYGLPVATTRCGNIFGPGDFNFSRIAPDAIRCALKDKTLFIRSDGKFTRDYVYVDDIVDAYMTIAEKLKKLKLAGEAFNFSNESPITVLEFVKRIYAAAGKKQNFKVLNIAKYEIKDQYLSSKKARKVLGWRSRYNMKDGLKNTIDWYGGLVER